MSRVRKLRTGAALTGVAATALLMAVTPASADAVKGALTGKDTGGYKVNVAGNQQYDTVLFGFKVGDKELKTYCVDIETNIDRSADAPGYREADWNSHPKQGSAFKENSAKINWVLHNGFPTVDEKALAAKVGAKFTDGLSVKEAVTATQAAVWHFSDKKDLNVGDPTPGHPEAKDDVVAVYKYLIGDKNTGIGTEPKPVLTLEPGKLTGKAGALIGPFTVTTSASGVTIAAKLPEGVIFSDKDGNELPKAEVATKIQQLDKYEFFVKVPANVATGKVEFTVSGDTQFSLGRLFVSADSKRPSQTIIVATSETVKLEKAGAAEWGAAPATETTTSTPAPQAKNTDNELANTGASILTPIVIGVVLVGAGVGALVFQRRRRA